MARQIIRCMQYDLFNTVPVVGQIYFCTDVRVLYKDNGPTKANRTRFNAVILTSDFERVNNIKPVIGKFYYIEQTNSLWLFDTRWVLKIGPGSTYNSYAVAYSDTYNGNYISPIINVDESITNSNGDKIIDNNGLLGDGSVGIRDNNRIIRGLLKADSVYQQIVFNSYLDNGFLFIPNSHLPYTDLSTSLGALHLTVDKNLKNNDSTSLDLAGQAYYYGTWNNYGDMYIVNKLDDPTSVGIDYTPNLDKIMVKLFLKCSKKITNENNEEETILTYITIRPISTTQAIANVVSLNEENANSVAYNDIGELIYTDLGSLEENITTDCTRSIKYENTYTYCTYTFDNYDNGVQIVIRENTYNRQITIPDVWSDSGTSDDFSIKVWNKKKVLTDEDIDVPTDLNIYIKRYVYETKEDENKENTNSSSTNNN